MENMQAKNRRRQPKKKTGQISQNQIKKIHIIRAQEPEPQERYKSLL